MAKVITELRLYDAEDVHPVDEIRPQDIVRALVQLEPKTLDKVMKGLKAHYDSIVGTE